MKSTSALSLLFCPFSLEAFIKGEKHVNERVFFQQISVKSFKMYHILFQ